MNIQGSEISLVQEPKSLPRAPFSYKSLSQKDSIRLLLVQPALSDDTIIRCSLIHTTLSECKYEILENYIALSYTWGNMNRSKWILIDDMEHSVTDNLYSALQDIRDRTRVLRLWADAICINQHDEMEKMQQISFMADIFSVARVTIIYLGPLD